MKKTLLFIAVLLLYQTFIAAQGLVFEELSYAEALEKAQKENKPIFMDFSTVWCGPCKQMEQNVFPNVSLGMFYNANFVNVKFDGEKGEGVDLVEKYEIKGFPSFLFLDANETVLYRFLGSRSASQLMEEATNVKVAVKYGGYEKMKAELEAGRSDSDFLWDIYLTTSKNQASLVKYLKSLPDSKLLQKETGNLFDNEKFPFDFDLYKRVVNGMVAKNDTSSDYINDYVYPVERGIFKAFEKAIENRDDKLFAQSMELKKDFAPLAAKEANSDLYIRYGRGYPYYSDDFVKLIYEAASQSEFDDFKPRMETYMDKLMAEHPLDSLGKDMNILAASLKSIPEAASFMLPHILNQKTGFMLSHLIPCIEYYWCNVPTTPDLKNRCEKWLTYAYNINPYNPDTPISIAKLLERIDRKDQALALLQKAVELRKEKVPDDEWTIKQMEITKRNIQNNK